MIVERRLSAHIDWLLIAALIALALIGLATIYSVTGDWRPGFDRPGPQFWTQLYALPVAIIAMMRAMPRSLRARPTNGVDGVCTITVRG